jgi:hypothetical protein
MIYSHVTFFFFHKIKKKVGEEEKRWEEKVPLRLCLAFNAVKFGWRERQEKLNLRHSYPLPNRRPYMYCRFTCCDTWSRINAWQWHMHESMKLSTFGPTYKCTKIQGLMPETFLHKKKKNNNFLLPSASLMGLKFRKSRSFFGYPG